MCTKVEQPQSLKTERFKCLFLSTCCLVTICLCESSPTTTVLATSLWLIKWDALCKLSRCLLSCRLFLAEYAPGHCSPSRKRPTHQLYRPRHLPCMNSSVAASSGETSSLIFVQSSMRLVSFLLQAGIFL